MTQNSFYSLETLNTKLKENEQLHLRAVNENAEGQDQHHDQYALIKADTYCVKHSRLDVKPQ